MSHLTSTTILAEICPSDGLAAWYDAWDGPGIRSLQATPPSSFGNWTPSDVPVTIRHDGPAVGFIDYLEWGLGYGAGAMFGVGVIEGVPADLVDGQVMASAEIRANAMSRTIPSTTFTNGRARSSSKVVGDVEASRAELHAVALVDRTASVTATMVRAWVGDYRCDWGQIEALRPPAVVQRAKAAATWELRSSRRPECLRIHHPVEPRYSDGLEGRHGSGRPEIHYTTGGYVLEVRSV